MSAIKRTWELNGERREVSFAPLARLLDVLREQLDLTSVKEGCGEGECGTCTVLIDGVPRLACLTAAGQLDDGTRLLTAEGLAREPLGRALQEAFISEGAVQCGYCTPGMLCGSYSLLQSAAELDEACLREALAGHLCRCTGYTKILRAVQRAAAANAAARRP